MRLSVKQSANLGIKQYYINDSLHIHFRKFGKNKSK